VASWPEGKFVLYALGTGVLLLALGVGIALIRYDPGLDEQAELEKARYESALRKAASEPPRFAVSYIEVPLAVLRRFPRRYRMIETDVARRIETKRPPLSPNFMRLARSSTNPIAPLFRELRVRQRWAAVVALLVTQTTPGTVARLRLVVDRLKLNNFDEIWDALDLIPSDNDPYARSIFEYASGSQGRTEIAWKPRMGEEAFIPLALVHRDIEVVEEPEDADSNHQLGDVVSSRVVTHVVLGPRRLVRQTSGEDVEITIGRALNPLVVMGDS
jgi:hypothetical protein